MSDARSCAVCSQPAPYRCDWPTEKQVHVGWKDLRVGDVWITKQKRLRGRVIGIDVQEYETGGCATIWVQIPGRKAPYPYFRGGLYSLAPNVTTCLSSCGLWVCEAHVREVADDRHYCCQHWHAWEQAA